MAEFDYLEPKTIEEACALLERHGDSATLVAGGTAVTMWISQRLLIPEVLVSLARIPDFDYVRFDQKEGTTLFEGEGLEFVVSGDRGVEARTRRRREGSVRAVGRARQRFRPR